jgi:carboxylesterase
VLLLATLAVIAILIGVRGTYPRYVERWAGRRRPVGADGIVVGAGPIQHLRPDAPAVLLLHGGGDTPQALAGLATYLFDRGYSVRAPLLPGHGRTIAALAAVRPDEWHASVRSEYDALRALHPSVALVGLSMGGALAITLTAQRPEVPALVLLAPYVRMPLAIRAMALTSALWGLWWPYVWSVGGRSIHDRDAAARALGHGILTPAALRALYEVTQAATAALPAVKAPTLLVQSTGDNRISRDFAQRAFDRLGAHDKKLVWTRDAGHVITVDYGYQAVFELTAQWLSSHRAVMPGTGERTVPT